MSIHFGFCLHVQTAIIININTTCLIWECGLTSLKNQSASEFIAMKENETFSFFLSVKHIPLRDYWDPIFNNTLLLKNKH